MFNKKFLMIIFFFITINIFSFEKMVESFSNVEVSFTEEYIEINLENDKEDYIIYQISYFLSILEYFKDEFISSEYNYIIFNTNIKDIFLNKKEVEKFFYITRNEKNKFIVELVNKKGI